MAVLELIKDEILHVKKPNIKMVPIGICMKASFGRLYEIRVLITACLGLGFVTTGSGGNKCMMELVSNQHKYLSFFVQFLPNLSAITSVGH